MSTSLKSAIEGISAAPMITLSNGLRVANFSSPHPFQFEDGSVLPACEADRVEAGALIKTEEERPWGFWDRDDIVAVVPRFKLSVKVWDLLVQLENDIAVDIVLIPLPVLESLRNTLRPGTDRPLLEDFTKVGTISVKDRVTKTIYINRFCR